MPHTLSIAQKLLSLKERFQITDADDQLIFECSWRFAWINAKWVLTRAGKDVAVFRKRIFALASTWDVQSELGDFVLRRKIFSFRRRTMVIDGPLDGAEFTGSLLGLSFVLAHAGTTLATASAKILTLRERHSVEVLDDRPEVELLTAILMANLLVEKTAERRAEEAAAASASTG